MIISVDFDATIVDHKYPDIGEPVPKAIDYIKKFVDAGAKIILNTMRSGKELQEAVNYLKDNNIELFGVNENPTQSDWTTSPKPYANLYIDDANYGQPLKEDPKFDRPYVDWDITGPEVLKIIEGE